MMYNLVLLDLICQCFVDGFGSIWIKDIGL